MGGYDLGVLYEDLKQKQDQQDQLAADLRALKADYPGFAFSIVTGFTGAAIEALPRAGREGSLVALIQPDAEKIRAALKIEGVHPKRRAAASDAALSEPDP